MINLVMSDNETAISLDVIVTKEAKWDYTSLFPESGLHPSKQMDVTEGIFKQYKKGVLGENIWVATHSELVILRAMRMIREGRASLKDFTLWQSQINRNGEECLVQIELDGDGEFLDPIKDGFFEQGFKERFA